MFHCGIGTVVFGYRKIAAVIFAKVNKEVIILYE
jgi:hypothetical protein